MDQVYVVDCERYDVQAIEAGIRAAVQALGLTLPKGKPALIHPECPWAHPRFAPNACTHPAVIEAAARVLGGNKLTIAANSLPGFTTRYAFGKAGYQDLARRLDARLVAIDEAPTQTISLGQHAAVDKEAALPKVVLEADYILALPKLSGSTFVGMAGAIRHHQSLLQQDEQLENHQRLHTKMADLLGAALPDLIVVDAIEASHRGGELSGYPVQLGALIVGTNVVAVDTVCAVAYGLDPGTLRYLQTAAERDLGPADPAQIRLLGDLSLETLRQRAAQVEHVDPNPEHFPLPAQVKVLRSEKSGLSGTAGALTETFQVLERGGVDFDGAREAAIVVGRVGEIPSGKSGQAAVVFVDDTSRAQYSGYSRIVRLRGRYVPTSKLLNDVPSVLKVPSLRDQVGGEMVMANLQSKFNRFVARLTGGGG